MSLPSLESPGVWPSRRRALRLAVAILAGAGLIALQVPEATLSLALFAGILLALVYGARRGARRSERAGAAVAASAPWPDAGMKAVVESLAEPALILDRKKQLRYRNPASLVAFGNMALGDAVTLRIRQPEFSQGLDAAMEGNRAVTFMLDEKRRIDRLWHVQVLPIQPTHGEAARFVLVLFQDRTAERRTEQMRTDFVANASHELRTPLASLMGFIETLQGPAKDDTVARERFLAIMREQATRMSRLIDDLLSLSRIEMKRHVPVAETVDLCALLETVERQMLPVVEEAGMSIETDLSDGPVTVAGEADELIQVFSNLVENACKYASSGGRVRLRLTTLVERGQRCADVSVIDHGEGIPEEHVPRLTERFYRVDVGSSRSKRGTGLGLSIVRNILLRHRARLIITSRLGEGSTFTARFPLSVDQ